MALTLSTLNKINPVYYSSLELVATESTADINFTYTFQVYVNDVLQSTIVQKATPEFKGELNLSPILSQYIESSVFTNASTFCEIVPNAIIKYKVDVTSKNAAGGTVATASTGDLYGINGTVQDYDSWNINDYLMISTLSKGRFLSRWQTDRKVTMGSKAYLSALNGSFGLASNPSFTGITITSKQKDGSTRTDNVFYSNTTASLVSVDVSPAKLKTISSTLIDDDTIYYDITERSGNGYPVRFWIERESKVKDTFNFLYVNSLGAVDHFDFTKVSEEGISISKEVFEQQKTRKVFDTEVRQQIDVISDWINQDQSKALRDLWYSPAVKLYRNGRLNEVIVRNSSMKIKNKFNEKLINYSISFEYSNIFKTQKY